MAKPENVRILQTDLLAHPATQGWNALRSDQVKPERIEILKGKWPLPDRTRKIKRFVCRLVGAGPAGAAVIGKRCRRPQALVESAVYTEILSHLPISSLIYYGMIEEADGEICWLFLADAGGEPFSKSDREHRALGARWLGLMHTSASEIGTPACLPDKGAKHYLKRLQSIRTDILSGLASCHLRPDDQAPMQGIVRYCSLVESHWSQLEAICDRVPQTLVHGDFVARNFRIQSIQPRMTLLAFDWGEAGWGVAAADLMYVDVVTYWLAVRSHWPWLDVQAIQQLAVVGKIFRSLDAIYWELPYFKYERLKEPRNNMRIYESWLGHAVRAAGLVG